MYLQGVMTVDPSELTHIVRAKPTRAFARMAHYLTAGLSTPKQEQETFTAIAILQQINIVMRSLGIDNVVRLAKDETVIYLDTEGKEGDLKEALDQFSAQAISEDHRLFDTLSLTLEHRMRNLVCLLEICVRRTHAIGEYPIQVTVNGLTKTLMLEQDEELVRNRMQSLFSSQQAYDAFVGKHRQSFDSFLERIEGAFRKHMQIDHVQWSSHLKIVRPSRRIHCRDDIPRVQNGRYGVDPLFYEGPTFDDSIFYLWLWSDFCHANAIECSDCTIVDESGNGLMAVDAEGIQAGETDLLNVDVPFEVPESAAAVATESDAVAAVEGGGVQAEVSEESRHLFSALGGESSSGGWLSSLGDFFGGDSGDGGSWGGGCGSCGGGD